MEDVIQRVLQYIKLLCTPTVTDEVIKFDIQECIERSCNYIQNSKFPMTCERTLAKELSKIYGNEELKNVSEIREGETTVKYDKVVNYDNVLNNMKQALNPFRKLSIQGLLNDKS